MRRAGAGIRSRGIALSAVLAVSVLAGCTATPLPDTGDANSRTGDVAPVIRVDQVGYGLGETKRAFVMGAADDLDDARFEVRDDDGAVVESGELGADAGPWSDTFEAVREIDLSSVDAAGRYSLEVSSAGHDAVTTAFTVASTADLLHPLADLNLQFFQAQRDGADVIPAVLDRKPSHLLDREATVYLAPNYADGGETLVDDRLTPAGLDPVDVSGGWFDAGDFLKFTGTSAYATSQLLLALRGEGDPALDAEADFGMDWLDRMWDERTRTLFLQVGIGNGNDSVRSDHDVWRLPEDDDLSDAKPGDPDHTIAHRPVFVANAPGEALPPSVAGRVSAAFALDAQRAAARGDVARAEARLRTASAIYAQTDTSPAEGPALATAIPAEFYPESSWQDDLEFAAVELATAATALGDPRAAAWQEDAAEWAARYIESDATGTLGVADVSALAHADLIALDDPTTPALLGDLRRQLDAGVAHAASDPFGAGASTLDFDAVPFTFGLITTAALYETASGDASYRDFATTQRGWVLGANAWGTTFMIGAGTTYPRCPEHQVANLTETDEELLGAVVNGPNAADKLDDLNRFETMRPCEADGADGVPFTVFDGQGSRYLDDVGAWQTVEPSLDFTSTALLAFALTAALPASTTP
ncbi:glycoside hydrolase family 9 protein [Microbacterium sp. W4I20]|uniref:glycoside hydrolase family 9 protein n=1 Tax=Microbacterium sp. W4I20 TaxID=3042262 RepID=UPI002785C500|nr:glycoside hydrolase family 9 protein [Microbacterium sp. W4I20]MDQ0728319.1 endoglucanase [Microbacterium sp. W4I20]